MMVSQFQPRPIAHLGASPSLDLEQITAISLDQLQSATDASFLALYLFDRSLFPGGFSATWKGNRLEHDTLRPIEESLRQQAITGQQAALQTGQTSDSGKPGTVAVLPLVVGGQTTGSVTLAWDDAPPNRFDLATVQVLANMLALALEHACLHQSQQYYTQALEYLGGLSSELNILSSAQEVVTRVEHIACALLSVERCAIFLSRDEVVTDVSGCNLSPAFIAALEGCTLNAWLPSQVAGRSIDASHVLAFVNPDAMPSDPIWREALQREGITAGVMALLQGHLRIFGSIALFYQKPYTPTAQEIRLLEILASQLAVALDNIELNEASELHAGILEQHVAERTQELAIALDKAEDADRLKTQLLSTVSHELRTPLSVIKAHTTMTLAYYDRLSRDRHISYLETINEEADRLTALINNLLDMGRLEAGRLEIKRVPLDPVPLFTGLRDLVQTRFPDRTFEWVIPPELPAVSADPERMRQVIENLVENAVKYSPPETPVEIGARAWDDALQVWVKDQGLGLTREQIRQLFERFYQVNSGNSHAARSGVGLGLAICKALVEEMKGRIWCESAGLNKGSKFAFTLPWATKE